MNKSFIAKIMANTSDFTKGIAQCMAAAEQLDDSIRIKFFADSGAAIAEAERTKKEMRSIPNLIKSRFDFDSATATGRLAMLNRTIKSLDGKTIDIQADADTAKATAQLTGLKLLASKLTRKVTMKLDIDTKGMSKLQIASAVASKSINTLNSKIGTMPALLLALSGVAIPVLAALVPAVMAVGNAIGVLSGGVIGLAGAFGIAGTGAVAFGAMAVRAYKMLQDGTIKATAQTQAFQTALDSLKSQFDALVAANADAIFSTMANGINIAKTALTGLTPFINGVANSMTQLSSKVLAWTQSSTVAQNFFNMMKTTGVSVFENVMTAAGKFGSGLVSLFTQFAPLFSWMSQGLANLGSQFDAWSQKVSTSQGIQKFISYVQTNLPLIGQIFGNTFKGIFNLFAAFGSNSQTIFQSLADMSSRFAQWSATVAQSQGFKQFIDYVQTNGPVLMSTIGSIVNALIAFGTAMAPIGAKVLSLVGAVAQWVAGFATAHPIITQIVGSILLFGGAIVKVIAFMAPFISTVMKIGGFILQLVQKFNLVRNVLTLVSAAFTLLTSPIGIAIAAVVAIGAAIYLLWTRCEAFRNGVTALGQALLTAGQVIMSALGSALQAVIGWIGQVIAGIVSFGAQILSAMQSAWNMVTSVITTALGMLVSHISSSFSNMLSIASSIMNSILSAASSIFSSIVSAISSAISSAVSFVSSGFSNMLSIASSIMSSILSFISSTWSSIISTISSAISSAVSFISSGFSSMLSTIVSFGSSIVSTITSAMSSFVSAISSGASQALSAVTSMVSNILSAITGAAGQMVSAGADLVRGFINGIQSMAGEAIAAAGRMASAAVDKVKSMLKIGSPSKVLKQIGAWTSEGMAIGITKAAPKVLKASKNIVKKAVTGLSKLKTASYQKAKTGASAIYKALGDAGSKASSKLKANNQKLAKLQSKLGKRLSSTARRNVIKQIKAIRTENRAYQLQKSATASLVKSQKSKLYSLTKIAKFREGLADRIKGAKDKLKNVLAERNDFKKSMQDDLRGYASIVNTSRKSSQGMIKVMQTRLKDMRAYYANIAKLKKMGINKTSLREILDAGIEQGGAIAKGLAKGGKSAVTKMNAIQSQINAVSSKFANKNADTFYKNGIDVARGLVKGLQTQDKQLASIASKIANTISATIRKKLGIHSPSRVMIALMQFVGKGLVNGLSSQVKNVRSAASKINSAIEKTIDPSVSNVKLDLGSDPTTVSKKFTADYANSVEGADANNQQVINIFMNTDLDVVGLKHEIDRIDGTDAHINVLSQGAY